MDNTGLLIFQFVIILVQKSKRGKPGDDLIQEVCKTGVLSIISIEKK